MHNGCKAAHGLDTTADDDEELSDSELQEIYNQVRSICWTMYKESREKQWLELNGEGPEDDNEKLGVDFDALKYIE